MFYCNFNNTCALIDSTGQPGPGIKPPGPAMSNGPQMYSTGPQGDQFNNFQRSVILSRIYIFTASQVLFTVFW